MTPERFRRIKRTFERFAETHAKLVADVDSQEAFEAILYAHFEDYWYLYSGIEMDGAYLWEKFESHRTPMQKEADELYGVVRRWSTRSLEFATTQQTDMRVGPPKESRTRRGYSKEVRSWMRAKGISSVKVAAVRLAVSESSLKSIMASKSKVRYGKDTLATVLTRIGVVTGDQYRSFRPRCLLAFNKSPGDLVAGSPNNQTDSKYKKAPEL